MKSLLNILLLILCSNILTAQVVISDPDLPTAEQPVTISFNAAEGNGGLSGYDGEVYAHTGVLTESSTGTADWKYVKTDWGENTHRESLR